MEDASKIFLSLKLKNLQKFQISQKGKEINDAKEKTLRGCRSYYQ
jgi:hypothetical protein